MLRCAVLAMLCVSGGCGRIGFDDGPRQYAWTFPTSDGLVYAPNQIAVDHDVVHLAPLDQTDDDMSATGFTPGAGLIWDAAKAGLALDPGAATGVYTSRVFDSGVAAVTWDRVAWQTERPSGKPVPDDASETAYALGNLDMTGAVLVAHMNEPSGIVKDLWGHHDGTPTNVLYGQPGEFDQALRLSGGFIDFGAAADTAFDAGDFSISVWVRRASTGTPQFIVSREQSGTTAIETGWCLYVNDVDQIVFCTGNPQGADMNNTVTDSALTDLAGWHHIVATHHSGRQTIYVDGQIAGAGTFTPDAAYSPNPVVVGRRYTQDENFDGWLDELVLFKRELSPAEARDLFYRGALRVELQVRSCPDLACAGVAFAGPDRDPSAWFRDGASHDLPSSDVSSATAPDRYFQYQARLATDTSETPRLQRVSIGPAHVFSDDAPVAIQDGLELSQLIDFEVELAFGSNVRFQVSADGQTWWYRANGSWTVATGPDAASTAAEITAGAASYRSQVGGHLLWRAVLAAPDATTDVGLRRIIVDYAP